MNNPQICLKVLELYAKFNRSETFEVVLEKKRWLDDSYMFGIKYKVTPKGRNLKQIIKECSTLENLTSYLAENESPVSSIKVHSINGEPFSPLKIRFLNNKLKDRVYKKYSSLEHIEVVPEEKKDTLSKKDMLYIR